jgi:large subunit ribosomal protein L15
MADTTSTKRLMHLGALHPAPGGASKAPKRIGRGLGSGSGGTAGKGHKGQLSRGSKKIRPGFEGGQMPLFRRIPKFGFTNPFRKTFHVINVEQLSAFTAGATVDKNALVQAQLIKKADVPVKILGDGELTVALTVQVDAFSKSAEEKIIRAGGTATRL